MCGTRTAILGIAEEVQVLAAGAAASLEGQCMYIYDKHQSVRVFCGPEWVAPTKAGLQFKALLGSLGLA